MLITIQKCNNMSPPQKPEIVMKAWEYRNIPVEERIYSRIKIDANGCHIWNGSKNTQGYGQVSINTKPTLVHRWIWEQKNGPIEKGKNILHRCDVPLCVNVSHLFIGTQKDNMQDCSEKGRSNKPKGFSHSRPMAKLTNDKVVVIKDLLSRGYKQSDIARDFQVSRNIISDIYLGKTWGHIK